MGEYVDIHGHPTWVEIVGPRTGTETVLLLHGGLSHSDELLGAIGSELAGMYRVVAFDRRGHGRTADTDAPFHFDDMATETIAVLESVVNGSAHLIGWSDGGIIALLAALRRPDLANRLVLIGTSFHVNGQRPAQPQPTVLAQFRSDYVERSPDGADHYDAVVEKSFAMFASEPTMTTADVAQIASPTLVLVGDDDAVELSHTCELYESLPAGQLAVVPGASHFVAREKPADVSRIIGDFLHGEPRPRTLMPSRRSASSPRKPRPRRGGVA